MMWIFNAVTHKYEKTFRTILQKLLCIIMKIYILWWPEPGLYTALITMNITDRIWSTWFIPAFTKARDGSQRGTTGLDRKNVWSCSWTKWSIKDCLIDFADIGPVIWCCLMNLRQKWSLSRWRCWADILIFLKQRNIISLNCVGSGDLRLTQQNSRNKSYGFHYQFFHMLCPCILTWNSVQLHPQNSSNTKQNNKNTLFLNCTKLCVVLHWVT
jgi:hypothetical protein